MVEININDIKQQRILKVFTTATVEIIKEKGIEGVTIREVAKKAGYNSATIYNYFDSCNELLSFAAMKFVSQYVQELPTYIKSATSTLERFILNWECFCEHCFRQPEIYYAVFTADIGQQPDNLIRSYYTLFPEDLGNPPQELLPMLMESDFAERCRLAIEPCIEEGYFNQKEGMEINEMIRLLYQGMLSLLINKRINYSAEEAVSRTSNYIRKIVNLTAHK